MEEVKFCHCRKLTLKYLNGVDNLLQKELTLKEKKYFPFTRQDILSQLTNVGDYFYIVIDQDEEVLAYGHMRTFDGQYKIPALGIVVSKYCRGFGLAELLCKYMLKDSKKKGYEQAMLKVNKENNKARLLYEKLGFVGKKVDKTHYWMYKDLND